MRVIAAPLPIVRAVVEPVGPRDWEVQATALHTLYVTLRLAHQVISASASFLESSLVSQAGA